MLNIFIFLFMIIYSLLLLNYYFIEVKAALLIKAISTVELDFLLKEVSHALLLFPSHY